MNPLLSYKYVLLIASVSYGPLVEIQAIKRFVMDCFYSSGLTDSNSEILTEAIVQADYRGIFSEGVSRLGKYEANLN